MSKKTFALPAFAAYALIILFSLFSTFTGYGETLTNIPPNQFVITIKSVELKNAVGEWLTVIEPDRRVDIAKEEPGLSFFNNGRVPAGEYVNFRLNLSDSSITEVTGSSDFQKPLTLKKGSFVGVWFSLDLKDPARISELSVTVDEDTRNLEASDVRVN